MELGVFAETAFEARNIWTPEGVLLPDEVISCAV
jgi:hypothetical protein